MTQSQKHSSFSRTFSADLGVDLGSGNVRVVSHPTGMIFT
mgnify:CR=1 FL=1